MTDGSSFAWGTEQHFHTNPQVPPLWQTLVQVPPLWFIIQTLVVLARVLLL